MLPSVNSVQSSGLLHSFGVPQANNSLSQPQASLLSKSSSSPLPTPSLLQQAFTAPAVASPTGLVTVAVPPIGMAPVNVAPAPVAVTEPIPPVTSAPVGESASAGDASSHSIEALSTTTAPTNVVATVGDESSSTEHPSTRQTNTIGAPSSQLTSPGGEGSVSGNGGETENGKSRQE